MSELLSDLLTKLNDRNTKARLDAANSLAKLGDAALKPVTELMNHSDYTTRRLAAYILGKIGNPNSVEILVDALGDENADVRKSAAQALNRIGEPAIALLIRALGNISKDVRASAVWSLSKMPGTIVVQPLIDALFSEVKDVRASAVWALSKVGTASIDPLIKLIIHDDKNVRESAIWGLAKIGTPAVERLAQEWGVRIGKEAKVGETETDSVDLADLEAGGENAIKQWIKFMIEHKLNKSFPASEDSDSDSDKNEMQTPEDDD